MDDKELYEALLARDVTDRRFRFHGSVFMMVTGLLSLARRFASRERTTEGGTIYRRGLIDEPLVVIALAGWGIGILLHFLEAHTEIDKRLE